MFAIIVVMMLFLREENVEFESLEMSEKHVRIRDTPEMWDGVSVDDMALPFTTRRHPSKAKAINEDFDDDFSVPLPKNLHPQNVPGNADYGELIKNQNKEIDKIMQTILIL